MLGTRRKHSKFAITSTKLDNQIFDLNDPEVVNEIKKRNFSLLYHHYLLNNDKNQALLILMEHEKSFANITVVKEIIHTYIYFNDFTTALEYIEKASVKLKCVKPYEFLIKLHLAEKTNSCSDENIFNLLKEGIEAYYDKRLIEFAIEFYNKNCQGCFCLKERLTVLQEIIQTVHYHELSYRDSKFLYKVMPSKAIFLKRMVETNPKIKRKYYLEYANVYGFIKEDISKILQAKFKTWAFEIALFFGWVEEIHRHSMEKFSAPYPLTINRKSKWNCQDKELYRFKDCL